jgi:hypothetical protein
MAMYLNSFGRKRQRCDEMGMDIQIVQGPPLTSGGWTDLWLYFWAMQPDFVDNSGNITGGGHFGLQAQDNDSLVRKSVINWGSYDNSLGGGATFRSSKPTNPIFIDYGNPSSYGFPWNYGKWYRFRVYKSPKQNYLAAEINDGSGQVAPYVGTNQQANETAFRCTIQNITDHEVPIVMFDILAKDAATTKAIANGMIWCEPLGDGGPTEPNQVWPFSPICKVRHPVFDGANVDSQYEITYYNGTPTAAHCDVILGSDYFQMYGTSSLTRTNPHGTILTSPSALWDAPESNANIGYSSTVAGGATPRPWY